MSKVATVQDILDASDRALIEVFKGKVAQIGKYITGTNRNNQPYEIQNLVITDGTGAKINCKFDGRKEAPRNWQGCEIQILAHNGQKGWSGVYAIDDTYRGKTDRILKVTASAEVICSGSGGQNAQNRAESGSGGKSDKGANQGKETRQGSIQPMSPAVAVMNARKMLAKQISLMLLSLDAAVYIGDKFIKRHPNIEFTTEQFQAITSSMYIHLAGRQWDDMGANFPIGDIYEFLDELRAAKQEQDKEKEFAKEKQKEEKTKTKNGKKGGKK